MRDLFYQWVYPWLDFAWLPLGLAAVRRGQRFMTFCFIICCIGTLRTQLELMDDIGHGGGILGLMALGLYARGLIIYGFVIGVFLVLARWSPNTRGAIFLAAVITLYIFAFCTSMLAMLL